MTLYMQLYISSFRVTPHLHGLGRAKKWDPCQANWEVEAEVVSNSRNKIHHSGDHLLAHPQLTPICHMEGCPKRRAPCFGQLGGWKSSILFTCCRQENTTFSPHFHTTWGLPLRPFPVRHMNSLTISQTEGGGGIHNLLLTKGEGIRYPQNLAGIICWMAPFAVPLVGNILATVTKPSLRS